MPFSSLYVELRLLEDGVIQSMACTDSFQRYVLTITLLTLVARSPLLLNAEKESHLENSWLLKCYGPHLLVTSRGVLATMLVEEAFLKGGLWFGEGLGDKSLFGVCFWEYLFRKRTMGFLRDV